MTLLHRLPSADRARWRRLQRLGAQYLVANRHLRAGDFGQALPHYTALSQALVDEQARIEARNLAVADAATLRAQDEDAERWLARLSRQTTLAGFTASFCVAVVQDRATLVRQLAELSGRGRDPAVIDTVLRESGHAVFLRPTPMALYNLGHYLDFVGQRAEALAQYQAALDLDPQYRPAWLALGYDLLTLGYAEEDAEFALDRAIALTAGADAMDWQIGMAMLRRGDFVAGWRAYESRMTDPGWRHIHARDDLHGPPWDGAPFDGTLYLHGEQGIGDIVQMLRYVPWARARCRSLILEVPAPLVALAQAMFPDLAIVAKGDAPPDYDRVRSLMSMPFVAETTLDTIPCPVSFRPCEASGLPIEPESGRIGLCWRGSHTHSGDLDRSTTLETVWPLVEWTHARGGVAQSLQYAATVDAPLQPMPVGDVLGTARTIARCEAVVTVDTSIAHLAGSLGVRTYLLVARNAEWRWLRGRVDSPWYPSITIVRQDEPGDYAACVRRVMQELA